MRFHIISMPGAQYAWGFDRKVRPLASFTQARSPTYRVNVNVEGGNREHVVLVEDLEAVVGDIVRVWPQATISIAPSVDEPTPSSSTATAT